MRLNKEDAIEVIKEAINDAMFCAAAPRMASLIAQLADKIREGEWKSLDSAPKDGTRILGYHANFCEEKYIIEWDGDIFRWDRDAFAEEYQPTHWQPLPDNPKEGE